MGRYHLSYDVEDSTEDNCNKTREDLIRALVDVLKASFIKRPVQSSVLFDTNKTDEEVLSVVKTWRIRNKVSYYISKVASADGGGFVDRWRPVRSLIDSFDQEVLKAKGGTV